MTVARVTEITVSSPDSFDAAIKAGVERATRTLHNITGAWVQEQKVVINEGQIVEYRVNMKLTFILSE